MIPHIFLLHIFHAWTLLWNKSEVPFCPLHFSFIICLFFFCAMLKWERVLYKTCNFLKRLLWVAYNNYWIFRMSPSFLCWLGFTLSWCLHIFQKLATDTRTKGMPVSSYLIKPMQRITRYPLLTQKVRMYIIYLSGILVIP